MPIPDAFTEANMESGKWEHTCDASNSFLQPPGLDLGKALTEAEEAVQRHLCLVVIIRLNPTTHITSHHITSHHFVSHHITSHHITSHHITSHYITSLHITPAMPVPQLGLHALVMGKYRLCTCQNLGKHTAQTGNRLAEPHLEALS